MNNLKELMIETLKEKGPFEIEIYLDEDDIIPTDKMYNNDFDEEIKINFDGFVVTYESENGRTVTRNLNELTLTQLSFLIQNIYYY